MKNRWILALFGITALFAAFTVGLFVGRNAFHPAITVSIHQTEPWAETAPSSESAAATEPSGSEEAPTPTVPVDSGLVNVNTADLETLKTLPGIGDVLAQRIIDYREAHGPFSSLEELTNVSGIGTGKLEAIWDYATVGG